MATQIASSLNSGKSGSAIGVVQVAHDIGGVKCDGGFGPLGHPVVYYKFDGKPQVTCGYCGRRFVRG